MKKIIKEYPERVLGAMALLMAGVCILCGVLWGSLANDDEVYENETSVKIINLNTATEEELKQLDGVSDVIAERIVAYREENGNFTCVEDLGNVYGIGEEKIKGIRNYVVAE